MEKIMKRFKEFLNEKTQEEIVKRIREIDRIIETGESIEDEERLKKERDSLKFQLKN
jgi:hypothetical protein